MQLMIDILQETPAALRLAANFLAQHAALREAMEAQSTEEKLKDNTSGFIQPAPSVPPVPAAMVPAAPAAPTTNSTAPLPPALSLVPSLPNVPIAPTAGISTILPVLAPVPALPHVPAVPNAVAPVAAPFLPMGHAGALEQYDASGVPFDARIHQKTGNKKKDGTWKLQRGIADAIVETVMRELAPRIRRAGDAPPPAIAGTPAVGQNVIHQTPMAGTLIDSVPLPPGAMPMPPVPPNPPGATYSNGVPTPPTSTGMPVPPVPAAGSIPVPVPDLDPYRALIAKITAARATGRMSSDEVTQCAAQAGAPSFQLLNNMPHLIPTVNAYVDAILATR